jgi:hypothetical protein
VFSKDTSHNIFIDTGSERLIDLLRDPWATEAWIASFQFDDGLDEFGGRSLWSWFSFAVSRISLSVLALPEQAVEFQQRRRLENHSGTLDMARTEGK